MQINKYGFNQNIYNYEQIIITIIFGYLGALLPNKNSNIPRIFSAICLGSFMSKVLYGDWDKGYKWTISDIFYWIITILETIIGGIFAIWIRKYSIQS